MKLFDTVADMKAATLTAGQFVGTKAYSADVGGAEYEVLTAGQYGATPDEFGDHTVANGNVAKLHDATPDLFQLGLIEGDVDNGPALKAAIENDHRVIVGHDGVITIKSAVNAVLTREKNIVSVGQGRRSNIKFANSAATIKITSPDEDFLFTMGGIGLTATIDTTGPALHIVFPFSAFQSRRQVTLANMDILGDTTGLVDFDEGIILENCWQSSVINCTIQGNSANKSKVVKGLTLKGNCVGTTISDNQINNFLVGIAVEDTSHDILINGNRLTQNISSIIADLSSSRERLIMSGNSITAEVVGISITDMTEVVIDGNRISKSPASTSNFTDIAMTNIQGMAISDNVCSLSGTSGTETGVVLINVSLGTIHDNVLQDRATLITLDAATTRVAGEGNVGDVGSTTVVDSGSGNNIVEAF